MNVSLLLRVKAEVVLGFLLAVRNRPVRIACLLSVTTVSLSVLEQLGQTPRTDQQTTVFLIAGSIAAVVAARLLAPGGALAASRQVAARFWLVPLGRLTGGALVVLPVVAVAALSLRTVEVSPLQLSVAAAVFSVALGAGVMTLAPAMGGSAAAVVGFVAACVGVVPPADLHAIFERWPLVQRSLALLWQLFPLQWRAGRLLDSFHWIDAAFFGGWIVIGVVLAGWFTTPVRHSDRWFRGTAWRH